MPNREAMLENQSIIDEEVFIQLIELDEDGSTEFLESVATEWFDQAIDTFTSMDGALEQGDLDKFSRLAHFLKGSSGQLGVTTLQNSCAKLQHLGERWDEENDPPKTKLLSSEEATKRIKPLLARAKSDYADAEKWLKDYLAAESGDEAGTAEEPETTKVVVSKTEEVRAKDEKEPVKSTPRSP